MGNNAAHPLVHAETSCPKLVAKTKQWLVLDKPAGWLTVSGRNSSAPVLVSWAREQFEEAWPVHRIDRETSGLVILARSRQSHREASLWFQEKKIHKKYLCICGGDRPPPIRPQFSIREPIHGLPAQTRVEVLSRNETDFSMRVTPLTGRRHQIRIHLASMGYPIWGDSKYGSQRSVSRLALHAESLELPSGESFHCPVPSPMREWLECLK